jgi:hypothetical protein
VSKVKGMDAWRLRQKKRNGAATISSTSTTARGISCSNGVAPSGTGGRRMQYSETKHLEEIRNEYLRCVQSWREGLQENLKNSANNRPNTLEINDVNPENENIKNIKQQIMEIYSAHNPSKLSEVNHLFSQNIGKEAELLSRIKAKYLKTPSEALQFPTEDAPGRRMFLNFSVDGQSIGQARFRLYDEIVPKTANNFAALCTGEKVILSPCSSLTLGG